MEKHVCRRELHILHLGKPLNIMPGRSHTEIPWGKYFLRQKAVNSCWCMHSVSQRNSSMHSCKHGFAWNSLPALLSPYKRSCPLPFGFLNNFRQDYFLAYFLKFIIHEEYIWSFQKINSAGNYCALHFFQYIHCKSTTHWSLSYTAANSDIFFCYFQSLLV